MMEEKWKSQISICRKSFPKENVPEQTLNDSFGKGPPRILKSKLKSLLKHAKCPRAEDLISADDLSDGVHSFVR